jgi:hypothetical protein
MAMTYDDIIKWVPPLISIIGSAVALLAVWLSSWLRIRESKSNRLHDNQGEVIAELYKRLYHVGKASAPLLAVNAPDLDKRKQDFFDSWASFVTYFGEHRLFLSKPLCATIDELLRKLSRGSASLAIHEMRTGGPVEENQKWWDDASKIIEQEVPKISGEIEDRFREMLGTSG